jgi:methyl-accepting chemotaxis protein
MVALQPRRPRDFLTVFCGSFAERSQVDPRRDDASRVATSARHLHDVSEGHGNGLEIEAIRAQVEQARTILADAVGKLNGAFSTIETETKVQKETMHALLAGLSGDNAGVGTKGGHSKINIRDFAIETGLFLRQFTDLLASVSQQSIRTVYRIDDMVEQLDAVFTLINSINGIADETFILAVNASIEAARTKDASQTGHSFSVIATNIRELSKKTRRFNDQIGNQVGKARATVNEVREIIAAMASRDLNLALSGKERIELMLTELEEFEGFVATSLTRANSAASRIGVATSQAVTALQFEDILNQLVVSVRDRAERIARGDEAPSHDDRPAQQHGFSDPVQQRNMSAGKVELF